MYLIDCLHEHEGREFWMNALAAGRRIRADMAINICFLISNPVGSDLSWRREARWCVDGMCCVWVWLKLGVGVMQQDATQDAAQCAGQDAHNAHDEQDAHAAPDAQC